MSVEDLEQWIEAIHCALVEADSLADYDGLHLWWCDTVENFKDAREEISG